MLLILIFCCVLQVAVAPPPIIVRPDHLEGVPLERDGDLNKEFRKEALLGKDVLRSSSASTAKKSTIEDDIRAMFAAADTDKDEKLTRAELKAQIVQNLAKHMDDGEREAEATFDEIDANGDGLVTWEEYVRHLLVQKHFAKDLAAADAMTEEHYSTDVRRLIDEEKATFAEADIDDNGLNKLEWLGFQHPEHSKTMLREMAEDILSSYDENRDGLLTADEFARPPPGEPEDLAMEKLELDKRRTEFRDEIDANNDGKATLEELVNYVDPKNERHAAEEVNDIMDMVDLDRDNILTLRELLNGKDALMESGFIRPKKMLHDDL
uniref:45 kDa calcium-binding protein n=1 Tax=Panagrellus redivivus TaxID=6233 RepID=A0A7E4VEP4_PANRE